MVHSTALQWINECRLNTHLAFYSARAFVAMFIFIERATR